LTYYRRLSLTEQIARAAPGLLMSANAFEKSEMQLRRRSVPIPLLPTEEAVLQYRLPQPEVARYVLPSYASHIILENTPDKETAKNTTVRIYRVEHKTLTVEEFVNVRKRSGGVGADPYHPTTYRPYFLGEFDARGNLI